jgi:hypothetical protein
VPEVGDDVGDTSEAVLTLVGDKHAEPLHARGVSGRLQRGGENTARRGEPWEETSTIAA